MSDVGEPFRPAKQRRTPRTCSESDCDGAHLAVGLCSVHYQRRKARWRTIKDDPNARRCSVPDCNGIHHGHGLCAKHYQRVRSASIPKKVRPQRFCSETDCEKPHLARGLCHTHYYRQRNGSQPRRPRSECSVPECYGWRYGHGLCATHYMRAKRSGSLDRYSKDDVTSEEPPIRARHAGCTVPDCDQPHYSLGLCDNHYHRHYQRDRRQRLGVMTPRPSRPRVHEPGDGPVCLGPDCDRVQSSHGLCAVHLKRVRRLNALDDWDEMRSTLMASSDIN